MTSVKVYPAGNHNDGTSVYRLLEPARVLINQGADIKIDTRGPVVAWNREWHGTHPPPDVRAMGIAKRPDCDVIVMQRPGRRWWADIIPMLQAEGIRVVVDVDDLFAKIDKGNAAHEMYDPTKTDSHNLKWITLACERADVVTVTTPLLKEHYGFGHGIVLPNLVPERYLLIEGEKRMATLGWSGTVETHPIDLQTTRGAVGRALDDEGWGFHVVGTGKGVKGALGLSVEPSTTGGWVPFAEYADNLAQIAVGIVPLADTPFNEAKSSLKMIELASVGVPVLASATYDNQRMQKLGVGVTVNSPSQWYKKLTQIIRNRDYRDDLAGRGRAIMEQYTYERKSHLWWSAWTGER